MTNNHFVAKKKLDPQKLVSVFENRIICGEEIEPFCVPTTSATVNNMLAAATNLVWWAMHEALADGQEKDARHCSNILIDIVGRELSPESKNEAQEIVDEIFDRYNGKEEEEEENS